VTVLSRKLHRGRTDIVNSTVLSWMFVGLRRG
jgi:hypothetical protein